MVPAGGYVARPYAPGVPRAIADVSTLTCIDATTRTSITESVRVRSPFSAD